MQSPQLPFNQEINNVQLLLSLAGLLYLLRANSACIGHGEMDHEAVYERLSKLVNPEPKKTVFNHVRLFFGIGMTTAKTVLLNEGLTRYIGPSITEQSGGVQSNGKGKFLVPGLLDSHCHIGGLTRLTSWPPTASQLRWI